MSLVGSFKHVIKIHLWGCDLIIDHSHVFWKLHDFLRNCLFPLSFCNRFIFACLNVQTPRAYEFHLEAKLMALFEHNLRWQGTILRALNVPVVVFKVVWRPIRNEVLAIHGVTCFQILPNLKQMGEVIDRTLREHNMVKKPKENIIWEIPSSLRFNEW